MRKKCVFVVGDDRNVAEALGVTTLPEPTGDFVSDVQAAVNALQACSKARIVIKGGTPYEAIVAAAAAFIEYRKTELIALHNPSTKTIETATLHALGTGETYHLRKTIMDLVKDKCTPIDTIADILGHTPKTIERHARLMKPAKLLTITNNKICPNTDTKQNTDAHSPTQK